MTLLKKRRYYKGKEKTQPDKKAVELYKNFHWKASHKTFQENIDIPKELIFIGTADVINYVSDKFDGKTRKYIHKFKKHGNILASPKGDMIIITGLKFKIKKEGITG